jgi:phage tail sheath protein FI
MPTYLTPGVYRTTKTAPLAALALVRTDIAGFVGFAERGPLPEDADPFEPERVALKITSWTEFRSKFGGFRRSGYLAYAVRAFFENGGDTCYVVRVAATTSPDPARQPAAAFYTLPGAGESSQFGTLGDDAFGFRSPFVAHGGLAPRAGDLVRLEGGGVTQLNQVADIVDGQILWTSKIDSSLGAGSTLARFQPACTIRAASRGNWGNTIRIRMTPLDGGAFALRATLDTGPNSVPAEDEFYRRLTLVKGSDTYAPSVLERESNLIRMDRRVAAARIDLTVDPQLATGQIYLQGGRDGLSDVTLRDFAGSANDLRGLRLLEAIDDIATVAIPDAVVSGTPPPPPIPIHSLDPCEPLPGLLRDPVADDPTGEVRPLSPGDSRRLQVLMIDHCERLRYRVALIDPPDRMRIGEMEHLPDERGLVMRSSRFAALYYPWLKVPDPLALEGPNRRVPPSGHIAGAYARNDLTRGVQHPPANLDLAFVDDVGQAIDDEQQGGLNQNNVNAIRAFPGRGIRVWGARSLAPPADADWRFIHVRRLMSAIEETAERSSRWAVFQNNDRALRSSLQHSLSVLLEGIWASGGLKGAKPADAFYVKCDATNNPQPVIDRGQLVCEVGVAVAAPMEFIVFEIRQDPSGAEVREG